MTGHAACLAGLMTSSQEPHAAPPDAAGHVGSHTVPEDVLNQNPLEKEDGPQPPLQAQVQKRVGGFQGTSVALWSLIAVAFAIGFFIAFR